MESESQSMRRPLLFLRIFVAAALLAWGIALRRSGRAEAFRRLRDGLLLKKDRDTGAIKTLSKAHWDQVIAVNLTGPFLCTRAFATQCVEQGVKPAVVVNMSSISRAGNMGQSNYSAAKGGLHQFTKCLYTGLGELVLYCCRLPDHLWLEEAILWPRVQQVEPL